MRNTGLDEAQAGIKIAGRNINNLRYADNITLMAESEEELKSPLMKVQEESEKVGLKLNIQKTKIMASGPITSWEIDGDSVETVSDFIFGVAKITVDGDCSHEIKRHLLLGRKVMTNLDSILKSRDITLPTKVRLVKAMVFPVVIYGCESWTVKKAEWVKIDAFELWCWRRLLRVPLTARRSNQSILKEISPGCSLEGLLLKLKLQYFGHLMWRIDSLEKTLMMGGVGDRRRRGKQDEMAGWHHRLWWAWVWVNSGSWWWTGRPGVLQFTGSQRVGNDWATELNWTDIVLQGKKKWPMTKWVHHDTQKQCYKWSQMLHNHGKSLFMKHEAKARGPGAREPDHCHHGQLLFPYKSSLTKILNP